LISLEAKRTQKRRHARTPITVLCELNEPATGIVLGNGCVLNFSRGGLGVVTPVKLSWGMPVDLHVKHLGRKGPLTVKVVNSRKVMENLYAYGLEFEGLNSFQRAKIERAFKALCRKRLQ